jgi:HTH-like domain
MLADYIEVIHRRSRNTYGRPRTKVELKDEGISISNDRLARLMIERQLQDASRRKCIRTTVRDRDAHSKKLLVTQLDSNNPYSTRRHRGGGPGG